MTVQGEAPGREHRRWTPPPVLGVMAMLLLGIVTAVCAAWVSRARWDVGGVDLPWGLGLAILSAAALVVVAAAFGRGAVFAAVVGWGTGVVLWIIRPGEAVIASDALGYAFLLLPTAALLIASMVTVAADGSSR